MIYWFFFTNETKCYVSFAHWFMYICCCCYEPCCGTLWAHRKDATSINSQHVSWKFVRSQPIQHVFPSPNLCIYTLSHVWFVLKFCCFLHPFPTQYSKMCLRTWRWKLSHWVETPEPFSERRFNNLCLFKNSESTYPEMENSEFLL